MVDESQGGTEYSMVVNGSLVVVPHPEVSYEEVTSIAYPVSPAGAHYRVAYQGAAGPAQSGTLEPGQVVTVRVDGTSFDVSAVTKGEHQIDVNTVPFEVPDPTVKFEQVVSLAYPNGLADTNAMFQVDYANAEQEPKDGELEEGGSVTVKTKGTEFIVIRSIRS